MIEAYMSSNYYIKKVIIPFSQNSEANVNPACKFILLSDISEEDKFMGITGVPAVAEESLAKEDCERKSPTSMISWLKIEIDEQDMFLDLEKTLANQSQYIQDSIFKSEVINILFTDEAKDVYKIAGEQVSGEDGENKAAYVQAQLTVFAQKKKEFLINFTGREYINFLNKRNTKKDSEQTTAYLYEHCHLKGICYHNENNQQRYLVFNAKEDITVKEIFRGV